MQCQLHYRFDSKTRYGNNNRREYRMTKAAQELLSAFDALPPTEQHEVAVVILRRTASKEDISEIALNELADELFCGYDAEEAADANRNAR
jgi:hypothetical protein